ncbi:hypothetical protein K504DRAFT_503651 [Pleomassaria siparia CBS 279.74]|uniref:Uncharacterized protein n=1 Tax=Pleomassaria siparia CBS 279.74 TaxID=1314801 RepID=A0A6G1K6U1_9PLEO|nr:hypothetical protein K504DRAFT_503651 [Pleomassaria siparia CBS 279.74]
MPADTAPMVKFQDSLRNYRDHTTSSKGYDYYRSYCLHLIPGMFRSTGFFAGLVFTAGLPLGQKEYDGIKRGTGLAVYGNVTV